MILDSFKLDGKIALVTGASRGIGQACALALAEAGADVALLGRSEPTETGEAITAVGHKWMWIECDLSTASPEKIQRVVDRVISVFGRLDIVVNNAGTGRRGPVIDHTEDDWDTVLHLNLKSVFFLSQAAGKVMMGQGRGKIINIASLLSFQGGILVPSYAAAKSGLAGITKAIANEWAPHNINVNAIAPGYIDTELTTPLQEDSDRNRAIVDRIPAGRWGLPEDMKGAVVFLASSASDYVHGTIMAVDGGWLAR